MSWSLPLSDVRRLQSKETFLQILRSKKDVEVRAAAGEVLHSFHVGSRLIWVSDHISISHFCAGLHITVSWAQRCLTDSRHHTHPLLYC